MPAQLFKIDGIGIKENYFHIEEYKENSHQEIFNCNGRTRIAVAFYTARKIFELIGCFFFLGPNQCERTIIVATKPAAKIICIAMGK